MCFGHLLGWIQLPTCQCVLAFCNVLFHKLSFCSRVCLCAAGNHLLANIANVYVGHLQCNLSVAAAECAGVCSPSAAAADICSRPTAAAACTPQPHSLVSARTLSSLIGFSHLNITSAFNSNQSIKHRHRRNFTTRYHFVHYYHFFHQGHISQVSQ